MKTTNTRNSVKSGLPPGTLIHVGKQKSDYTKLSLVDYSATEFVEKELDRFSDYAPFSESDTVSWINLDGLHNTDLIQEIGDYFKLHPLLLEDVLNTNHRPKMEEFDNCIFITLKMLGLSEKNHKIVSEQISIVIGDNWLISFQEQEGDIFDPLRLRLGEDKGKIRGLKADYLLYRLLDMVVDNYFFVTEHCSEVIEDLEEKVLQASTTNELQQIQSQKRELMRLRKSINPLREAVLSLKKDANDFIGESTLRYLNDVYEHIIQVNDALETQREMVASVMDLYHSEVSNKMNQIMKVLTIIATIFIPLTFVAGIYGMNFDFMPELHWDYGYLYVWIVMVVIIIAMIAYFKKKRWL